MNMTDVLATLPEFRAYGLELPLLSRRASFEHLTVSHPILYVGEVPEPIHVRSWQLSYTIPFREDIARGPYRDLFTQKLPAFLNAFQVAEETTIRDPILGTLKVVPGSYSDTADPNRRDGVDVEVTFRESPDLATEAVQVPTLATLQSDAGALDEAADAIDWPRPEDQPPNLTDPFSAIAGVISQVERYGEKIAAVLDDVAFRADKLDAAVARVGDPRLWPVRRSSKRLAVSSRRLAKRVDPVSATRTFLVGAQQTVTEVAAEVGMTLKQFLELNPALGGLVWVPARTKVVVYDRRVATPRAA